MNGLFKGSMRLNQDAFYDTLESRILDKVYLKATWVNATGWFDRFREGSV